MDQDWDTDGGFPLPLPGRRTPSPARAETPAPSPGRRTPSPAHSETPPPSPGHLIDEDAAPNSLLGLDLNRLAELAFTSPKLEHARSVSFIQWIRDASLDGSFVRGKTGEY